MCDKKPYIDQYEFNFTAYIPYCINNNEHEECYYGGTFEICKYFGFSTTRKIGEPTYTNRYGDDIYEIGVICNTLNETYAKINEIQNAILNKGGKINNCGDLIKIFDCRGKS